jgi:hypothetical protein
VPTSPSLLSEVRFGAFLAYSPRGTSSTSVRSRRFRDNVKLDRPDHIRDILAVLSERFEETPLRRILSPDATIVPAPRSAPFRTPDASWPARRIATELVEVGLGAEVFPVLQRVTPVKKSAYANRRERPTPQQHLESFGLDSLLGNPSRIVIVDDVITKGATLIAAASALRAAYPDAEIRTFAVLRTMGLDPEVEKILDPCEGAIKLNASGRSERKP